MGNFCQSQCPLFEEKKQEAERPAMHSKKQSTIPIQGYVQEMRDLSFLAHEEEPRHQWAKPDDPLTPADRDAQMMSNLAAFMALSEPIKRTTEARKMQTFS